MEIDIKKVVLKEYCNILVEFPPVSTFSPFVDKNHEKTILKKYFTMWKRKMKAKRERMEIVKLKLEQREKIENLMKALKKHKREMNKEKPDFKDIQTIEIMKYSQVESIKSRFEAQKLAIKRLTSKLEEKDRLINDLKEGIYCKDTLKTLDENKIEINEIFKNCGVKTRCKLPPPVDYNEKFMVSTRKVPKIMQEVEKKALERAQKREVILERKRTIEERRKNVMKEALENKKARDEEEKKRNLEMLKEQRRKELEREKIRQENKMRFLEKLKIAVEFHCKQLLKKYFRKLAIYRKECKNNLVKSVNHFNNKLLMISINKWKVFAEEKYVAKYSLADSFFREKILMRMLKIWVFARIDGIRQMQVAEDYYDFKLQWKTFVYWHRYVCVQYVIMSKRMKTAEIHYNRRILFQYFYQWRSLPAVIQLEKAKNEKKRKWREKVWDILPDYRPPED